MRLVIIGLLFFLLFALPTDAKRSNIEDFFKIREELIQKIPTPEINPTSTPHPTPTPAILLPNDSEVQSYLQDPTDNTSSLSASITHAPTNIPNPYTPRSNSQSDQTIGIIASFATFTAVALASYHGIFNRGIFQRL